MSDKFKGTAALLITAMVWGTGFISQKLGNDYMPPVAFNSVRHIMALFIMLPMAAVSLRKNGYFSKETNTSEELAYKRRNALTGGLVCGLTMIIGTAMQQIGLITVSAGKSGFISATYIVFVLVLNGIFGRRISLRAVCCTALALFGFAVMSLSGDLSKTTSGDWITLLGALILAFQIHFINKYVDEGNSILLTVLQSGFGGLIGLVYALLVEHPQMSQIVGGMPLLIYSTLVPTVIGYTLQVVGQKYTEPSLASLLLSTEAVFAALFGALYLKELMSAREIAGSLIILTAILIGQRERSTS